ncbi:Achaete-scute 4 [Fasciolopsis buskii]|uniref:Achaete-scute 4 n=1 Tax=Fasciolopsis buskii TaxID=27845 RepID=A0A8E0RXK3_9TREM|nr:Achaete-scute 4 [Fasciolopsis buski]
MSNLYLPSTQARFPVSPNEFFAAPAYECLQPFLNPSEMELCLADPFRKACAISAAAAVAAAAVEQTVSPNFHTYSAYYYDAVMSNREANPCFSLYSTPSSLAAAIMNTKSNGHVPDTPECVQMQAQHAYSPSPSALSSTQIVRDPPAVSSGLHMPNLHVSQLPAPVPYGSNSLSMQSILTQSKSSPAKRTPKKQISPQPNRTWSCQCTCSVNAVVNGSCGRSDEIGGSETPGPSTEWDMFSSVGYGASTPPFECAKSFIRRRNARERERVRCVNAGYELLRRRLPLASMSDRRLAKVEILRGAISYINSLKDMLEKTP